MYVTLQNGHSRKKCKLGFSWTILIWGGMALLYRRMGYHYVFTILTFGIARFYYMFVGNTLYLESLLERGYEPINDHTKAIVENHLS